MPIDLTSVALEIARDAQPNLSFQRTLDWIEHRGEEIERRLQWSQTERMQLHELARCLAGTHGLHGTREAFEFPECSYLNCVIATGRGIPISLSAIYMAVADRAGVLLSGVSAPMHFLCRYDGESGPLFLDAFHNGRLMTLGRCLDWLREVTNLPDDELEHSLLPASPHDVVSRMLNNLKTLYVRREQWLLAWKVQLRLSAMHPEMYGSRRDLGLLSLKAQRPGLALRILEHCLNDAACPAEERITLERHITLATTLLATWN